MVIAWLVRSIPEVKAGVWPIGYDTFNTYAAELATYQGPLINWLRTANILYFIYWPFVKLGIDAGLLMKISGPLLFGGLVFSFYFWARSFVGFKPLKALLAGFLVIFQLAALRLSWDLFRNELALIFLFWALINLNQIQHKKNLILAIIFSVLVGFSNELVTAIYLIVLFVYFGVLLWQKKYRLAGKEAIPFLLLLGVFWLVVHSPTQSLYSSHIYFISDYSNRVWHYFYHYQQELSYQTLYSTIVSLFWLLYKYFVFFAVIGLWFLRKNLVLAIITLWLLAGTFSALIFAGTGLIVWERWLFMLGFPVAIYTVEGAFQLGGAVKTFFERRHLYFRSLALTLAGVFWVGFIALLAWQAWPFLSRSYRDAEPPMVNIELNKYFPRTMVHNSVGIWKIEDTSNCINWLDQNVPAGAVVLVDNRYRGLMLTNFELDNRNIITNTWSDEWSKKSLEFARKKGFREIYLLWESSKGIKGFDRMYASGSVSVFEADID